MFLLWTKSIFRSKTAWLAVIGSTAQILGILSGVLPEKYVPLTIAIQGTLSVWCRFFTQVPVSIKGD